MKKTKDFKRIVEKNIILDNIIEELSKKYNKKKQVIKIMIEKCESLGYNIQESKEIVDIFLKYN